MIPMPKKTESLCSSESLLDDSLLESTTSAKIPIIGIGASAGGLEAFEKFFRLFPVNSGSACVVISHLDPDHDSMLTEILGRVTKMPVNEVKDSMRVLPDQVYIIPPNRELTIFQGSLYANAITSDRSHQMKVDQFFRSLAEEQGYKSIGIIFSGTGTDGTLGLRAIQGAGGITLVQDPKTAKFEGMPNSAIMGGFATYILPIEEMPDQLMKIINNLNENISISEKQLTDPFFTSERDKITQILKIIRSRTGNDFSQYKKSTIHRRIRRRMDIHLIEKTQVYIRYLEEHPEEVKNLSRELLINVTSFFRDPEAFSSLKEEILPDLIRQKGEFDPVRVWVPGCSTGEEAYSIAILVREILDDLGIDSKVQIYGTDIAEDAILTARQGIFPPNIAADILPEYLQKYFIREEGRYRVKKEIREMVIFAVQNLIRDPPFTKIDLISCRNLLIYLESELQAKIISTFHYALNPNGVLFLSPSETIGCVPDLFTPKNRKWKIYGVTKQITSIRSLSGLPFTHLYSDPIAAYPSIKAQDPEKNIAEITRRALLNEYAPASVVTDKNGYLLYVYGDTGKYLRPAPGQVSLSVIEMAREGLELELRTAIHMVSINQEPVFRENILVKTNGGYEPIDLTVRPIIGQESLPNGLIISFIEAKNPLEKKKTGRKSSIIKTEQKNRLQELEQEILYTRENLQATIEEMQASNEELKSTNEELQSTNEELETSREELQSVNEELLTVNAELQAKIEQLFGMQNDMKNLLNATSIATIFLTRELFVRWFTPESTKIFKLLPSDIGRPLGDIKSTLIGDDLMDDVESVLESLIPIEREVKTSHHDWYQVRIMPYRTFEDVIDGIVITFIDITHKKHAEKAEIRAREYAENIIDTIRDPFIVLDPELKVKSASRSFYQIFNLSSEEIIGIPFTRIFNHQWDIPSLIALLKRVLPEKTFFENISVTHTFPKTGERTLVLNVRGFQEENDKSGLIMLAFQEEKYLNKLDVIQEGSGDE